jgi:Zn-dependent protease with chaperone function
MRILLFLASNAAILVVISVVFQVFGLEGLLQENGVDLNLQALLLMSAVIGFGGSFISLLMSKWMAKRSMGVQVIDKPANQTEQWLVDTVRRQSREAGIGMPEVGIVIFLSRIIGHVVDRVVFKTQRGYGPAYFITSIAAQIFLSILASMIVMWFSRRREFRADTGGSELAGRDKMIAALRRLQQASGEQESLPDQLAAFGIAGGVGHGLKRLFLSHPPLAERIAALEAGR